MSKKLLSILIIIALVLSSANIAFGLRLNSDDLYTDKNKFNHNYVLTSNQATDIVAVAMAQKNKTEKQLAYDDAWCAAFVSDCARLAGISSDIIPFEVGVRRMYNFFSNEKNATRITSEKKAGDIVIYHCKACGSYPHIGIVVDANSSIEGNMDNKVLHVTGNYYHTTESGEKHSTSNGIVEKLYFRPNYITADLHTHSYVPYVTAPTCTEKGYTTFFCSCGDFYTDLYMNATGHDYHNIANIPAGCVNEGEKLYRCSGCYDSYVIKEPAEGHTPPVWALTSAASCTADGERLGLCSDCGAVISSETIAATGHKNTYVRIDSEPTAEHTGIKTERCTECDTVIASYEFEAHSHVFGYESVIKPATCTENGLKGSFCAECNSCYATEEIEKTGHGKTVSVTTKAPTCTESGEMTEYCSVCENALQTKTLSPLGHTQGVWTTPVNATCTEAGEKICTCVACGFVIESETIPAKGHGELYRKVDFEATPDHIGQISEHCSDCHEIINTLIFMHHEHTYGHSETLVKPTCLNEGEKGIFCAKCNSCYDTEIIPAKGHDESVWIYDIPADCTTPGEKRGVCPDCGESIEVEETPALGHDEGVWVISVPATCTTVGEETKICTRCKSVIETREIPALNHDNGVWTVSIKATCRDDGEENLVCTACGEVIDSKIIPAFGHDDGVWKIDFEATPDHDGQMSRYCSICNEVLESKTFGVHQHVEGYRKTVIPPTCTNDGEGGVFCEICSSKYETYVIPALGHIFSEWYMNNDSTHSRTCSRCHYNERNNCEFNSTVYPPSCTQGGYTEHICNICTFKYIDAYVDPLGHDWSEWTENPGQDTHTRHCQRTNCEATETKAHNWSEWVYEDEYEDICPYKDTMIRYCPDCGATERKEVSCKPCIPISLIIGGTVIGGATTVGIISAWYAAITSISVVGAGSAIWIFAKHILPELQKMHTVTYRVDGEVYRCYVVKEGAPVPVPENPQVDGKEFAGWEPEVPEVMPDHDLVFDAKWEENLIDVIIPDTGSVTAVAISAFTATGLALAAFVFLKKKKEN